METDTHILFYGHQPGKVGCWLSNFWSCNFVDPLGRVYNCSEQYFMLQKALLFDPTNIKLHNRIMAETDPKKIKLYGRQVKNYDDDVWLKCSFQVMFDANYYKFTQNPELGKLLIKTGNKTLVEAALSDSKWGAGASAKKIFRDKYKFNGANWLGEILEQVRTHLIEKPQ